MTKTFRLGFVMAGPTQFEAPFFKFITRNAPFNIEVLYLTAQGGKCPYDPELSRTVCWGFDLYEGYRYRTMPSKGWFAWLFKNITASQFDALIINGYYSLPLFLTALIAKMRGIKTALRLDTVEFSDSGSRQRAKNSLKKMIYHLYDHYFAVSSLTADYLQRRGIPSERISYFTYAVDVDYFRKAFAEAKEMRRDRRRDLGIPENARVVLAVSKLSPRETPWDLLYAFTQLDLPDAVLLLVGDGPDREAVGAYVKEHSLQGRVVFAGYIPYPELPKAYALSDVFVHATADEPWGVSVAEAMACGLPVITSSRVGAGYDLVREGQNGYRYTFGDHADLSGKLREVLMRLLASPVAEKNLEILSGWDYRACAENIQRFCAESGGKAGTAGISLP